MRLAEVEEFIESLFETRRNDCFDRESEVHKRRRRDQDGWILHESDT